MGARVPGEVMENNILEFPLLTHVVTRASIRFLRPPGLGIFLQLEPSDSGLILSDSESWRYQCWKSQGDQVTFSAGTDVSVSKPPEPARPARLQLRSWGQSKLEHMAAQGRRQTQWSPSMFHTALQHEAMNWPQCLTWTLSSSQGPSHVKEPNSQHLCNQLV